MFRVLFLFSLLFFSTSSFAAKPGDCVKENLCDPKTQKRECQPAAYKGGEAVCVTVEKATTIESRKECTSAIEDYEDVQNKGSDFRKGCSQVPGLGRATAKRCLEAANKCQLCVGTAEDEAEDSGCLDDSDEYDDDYETDKGVNGYGELLAAFQGKPLAQKGKDSSEIRRAKRRYKECPLYAVEELDDIVERRKEFKETVDSSREQLNELVTQLKTEIGNLEELQTEQNELLPKFNDRINEIVQESDQALQDKISRIGDEISQILVLIQTNDSQLLEEKRKIILMCRQKAEVALQELKNDRAAKRASGRLRSKGGMAGLLNLKDAHTRLEEYALSVQNNCLKKDGNIKALLRQAEDTHRIQNNNFQNNLRKKNAELSSTSNELMNSSDPERRRRLKQLDEEYKAKLKQLTKEMKASKINIESLEKQIAALEEAIAIADYEYQVNLSKESLAKEAGAREGRSENADAAAFLEEAAAYEDLVLRAYSTCGCVTAEANDEAKDGPYNKCSKVRKTAESVGVVIPKVKAAGNR